MPRAGLHSDVSHSPAECGGALTSPGSGRPRGSLSLVHAQEGLATMRTSEFDPAGRRVLQHDMLDELTPSRRASSPLAVRHGSLLASHCPDAYPGSLAVVQHHP